MAAMERALELTLDYVKERKAFGKPSWDFQNTSSSWPSARPRRPGGRVPSSTTASASHLKGELDAATAAMAKYWVSDQQCKVMDECLQLFGGYGYMMEYPIARMYATPRAAHLWRHQRDHEGADTYQVRRMELPPAVPHVRLTAPSGAIWTWGEEGAANAVTGSATEFCQVVTQVRNVSDTKLVVRGPVATQWMAMAQCFAGAAEPPPAPGTRFRRARAA
jgi:hypothetical protein